VIVLCCAFIYCLIKYLEYACLLVIVVHGVRYFILCILIKLKVIDKRKKSKDGLEGSVPQRVGGGVCHTSHT
jgi:hypothetical protein